MSINSDNWKNHFKNMAKGKVSLLQKRHGLGTNSNGKVVYYVKSQYGSGTVNISPVQQGIQQAKSELKNEYGMSNGTMNKKYIKTQKRMKNTLKTSRRQRRKKSTFPEKKKIGIKHKSRKRDIFE